MGKLTLAYALAGVALATLMPTSIDARTATVSVFESGRVNVSTGSIRPASASDCDEGLLFEFSESASPDRLNLNRRDQAARDGEISLEVMITHVCEQVVGGQAALRYEHNALDGGVIGQDIEIQPIEIMLNIQLGVGNSTVQPISYAATGNSRTDHRFELAGNQISFSGGGGFGTASRQRSLAEILVTGADFSETPGLDEPGRERERDAARALDDACESEGASAGLQDICQELAAADSDVRLQVFRALDPHELAAVPSAATEMGQVQVTNVGGRLAALRGGATGISLDGLGLSFNGIRLDRSWLPASLLNRVDSEDSGSTLLDQRWGAFVNGDIAIGNRDERGKEVGFDFDSWGLTGGIDYRFDAGHIFGLAAGYNDYSADLDDDGGKLDSDTLSLLVFGSIAVVDELYIDLTLGRGWLDFDQRREIDLSGLPGFTRQSAFGSTTATQWTGSATVNYRFRFGDAWQLTPYGQFLYSYTEIDGFAEAGGSEFALVFPNQNIASRVSSAGARLSRPVNLARSVVVPFVDLAYEHESGKDAFALDTFFVTSSGVPGPVVEINDPDRNFMRADIGASWVFVGGMQAFFSYSALLLDSNTNRHSFHAGLRWAF